MERSQGHCPWVWVSQPLGPLKCTVPYTIVLNILSQRLKIKRFKKKIIWFSGISWNTGVSGHGGLIFPFGVHQGVSCVDLRVSFKIPPVLSGLPRSPPLPVGPQALSFFSNGRDVFLCTPISIKKENKSPSALNGGKKKKKQQEKASFFRKVRNMQTKGSYVEGS